MSDERLNQGTTSPSDPQGFQKVLGDGLQNYMRALREVYIKGAKRSEELNKEFMNSQKQQQVLLDDHQKEDYRKYIASLQQAWGQDDAQSKLTDAYRDFLTSVNEHQIDSRKTLEDLTRSYIDAMQGHYDEVQKDYVAAYQDYLRSLQSAWQNADIAKLDSSTINSAGKILIEASNYAGQTISLK